MASRGIFQILDEMMTQPLTDTGHNPPQQHIPSNTNTLEETLSMDFGMQRVMIWKINCHGKGMSVERGGPEELVCWY